MPEITGVIDKLLTKQFKVPELADMVQAIMREFNGFETFAKEWHVQYTAAQGAAKASMLRDFTRLMVMANEQAASNPVEAMSTEELEMTVKAMLSEYVADERFEAMKAGK